MVTDNEVKNQIETMLPGRLGDLAEFSKNCRLEIKRLLPNLTARREFWRKFFTRDFRRNISILPATYKCFALTFSRHIFWRKKFWA